MLPYIIRSAFMFLTNSVFACVPFLSDTPTASGLVLEDTVVGQAGLGRHLEERLGPSQHWDRAQQAFGLHNTYRGKYSSSILLIFHKDFQKPDSEPETQTLCEREEKNTYYATISALPGQQTCKYGERRTRCAYCPHNAQAHGEASASRSRRGAHQKSAPTSAARFRPEA